MPCVQYCIVIGCLCPTPTDYLPILGCIQPADLCRQGATLLLAYRGVIDPKQLFHRLMVGPVIVHEKRLRSRHPFVLAVRHTSCSINYLNSAFELHKELISVTVYVRSFPLLILIVLCT